MPLVVQRRPERLNITNLQTGEGFLMQFNPTQFRRAVSSAWQRHEVLGQSYRPLDYLGTNNTTVDLSVYFRAENRTEQQGLETVMAFLESLQYPPETADSLGGRRPPRVLVAWPRTFAFAAILTSYEAVHEMFDLAGRTIQATVKLTFEEARRSRLTQENVRQNGPFRAPQQTGGE